MGIVRLREYVIGSSFKTLTNVTSAGNGTVTHAPNISGPSMNEGLQDLCSSLCSGYDEIVATQDCNAAWFRYLEDQDTLLTRLVSRWRYHTMSSSMTKVFETWKTLAPGTIYTACDGIPRY